ncbi:MAG: mechanosensitive ion channel family protein [Oscillospiraceae bacterium]|nr:mechanosensitive ion channel family protein [Oscillospiraceae bacterium]
MWDFIRAESGTLYDILAVGFALLALVIALRVATVFLRRVETRLAERGQDVTSFRYIRWGIKGTIYLVCLTAALRHIPGMNTLATNILAGSGIVAVVVGLASQQALGNVVSGAILLLFRPFQVGDTIRYLSADATGVVEAIGLRHTTVRTGEGKRLLIPNSLMNTNIVENISAESVDD